MKVLKKQPKSWIKEYLHRVFELSVGHLDKDHKNGLSILAKQVFRHRVLFFSTLLFGIISTIAEGSSIAVLGVAGTVITGKGAINLPVDLGQVNQVIDNWLASQERSNIFLVLVGIALMMQLTRSILTYFTTRLSIQLNYVVKRSICERTTNHLMSFSLDEIESRPVGYSATIVGISSETAALIRWGSDTLLIIYFLVMYLALLFISQSTLAYFVMGLALVLGISITRIVKKIKALSKQHVKATLDTGRITFEYLQAPRLVRVFNATEYAGRSINSARADQLNTERRSSMIQAVVKPTVESTLVVGACIFLIAVYWVAGHNTETLIGSVTIFILVLLRATPRLNQLVRARLDLAIILAKLKIVGGFLRTDDKSFLRSDGENFDGLQREISFDQLSFRYSERNENALEEISFNVAKGSTVAVVGPSGAGKSTLMSLLLGLHSPTGGQILIDSVALEDIKHKDWLQHIGYVEQEVHLFNASIMENIAFGNMEATAEDVVAAARKAYADDFIRRLPQGYDTNVGDRGYRLSGGQKQRLGLARALIRKPNILLLDEATSALDSESERLIQQTIRELHSTCTIFIIAHRLSTAQQADMILVLDSGRVLEKGTVEQLMAYDSYYLRVLSMQGNVEGQTSL